MSSQYFTCSTQQLDWCQTGESELLGAEFKKEVMYTWIDQSSAER